MTSFRSQLHGLFFTLLAPLVVAQPLAPADQAQEREPASGEAVVMSVFEVSTARDTGYRATNSISGTKFDTAIIDIPMSLQVVTEEFLRDTNAFSLEEAVRYTSGVTRSTGNNNEQAKFNVRGIRVERPKRNGYSRLYTMDMTNVARVEIVKGPASLLYGQSEPGGIINYITKAPSETPMAAMTLLAGSYDFYRAQFESTGPLGTPKLLYRIDGSYESYGNWLQYNEREQSFISGALRWRPFTGTQITFEYEYQNLNDKERSGAAVYNRARYADWLGWTVQQQRAIDLAQPTRFGFTDPRFNSAAVYWDAINMDIPREVNRTSTESAVENEFPVYTLNVEQKLFENWMVRANANLFKPKRYMNLQSAGRGKWNKDAFERFPARRWYGNEDYQYQLDVAGTFELGPAKNQFLVGAELIDWSFYTRIFTSQSNPVYYWSDHPSNRPNVPLRDVTDRPTPVTSTADQREASGFAYYVSNMAEFFNERLRLLTGVRFEESDEKNALTGVRQETITAAVPQFGLNWRIGREVSVYASYAESFVPIRGNFRDRENQPFTPRPLEGVGTELGVKTELFDGRVSGTLALFDIERRNIVRNRREDDVLGGQAYQVQSGRETSRGVEMDFVISPTPAWQIMFAYAYTDSGVVIDGDLRRVLEALNYDVDLNGIAGVPRHQFALFNTYEFRTGNLRGLRVSAGANWLDERRASSEPEVAIMLPSYTTVDASVAYDFTMWGRKSRFSVNVKNVLDKDYFLPGPHYADPRTITASLRVTF